MSITLDLLNKAVALHQAGRGDDAARLYRLLLTIDPSQADALHLQGLLTRRGGRMAAGIRMMQRALAVNPALAPAHLNLGQALHDNGLIDEAEPHYRKALAGDPGSLPLIDRLASLLLVRGAFEEAEPLLRRLVAGGLKRDRSELALRRCALYCRIREAAADPSLPAGLVVRGVFRDNSGYAYKVRQFVRHLVAAGIPVHLVDLHYQPVENLDEGQLDPLFRGLDRPVRAKAVLSFTTPPVVEAVPGLKTIVYTVFEGVKVPAQWAALSRRHDATIVATPSSRDAWTAAGCPAGLLHLCPEGVEEVQALPSGRTPPTVLATPDGRRVTDYAVRVLNISDLNPRKNLEGLLRVWLRATRAGQDAVLILKVGKSPDMLPAFRDTVLRATRAVGRPVEQAAPILLLAERMSDEDMMSLHAASTHYWSMSHGEGWDLPMAQAGATGLTLLAPRHSAYTAYLHDGIAHMIPSRVADSYGDYSGLQWWEPDEDAAADLVAQAAAGTLPSRSARRHLLENFGWSRVTGTLIDTLRALDAL